MELTIMNMAYLASMKDTVIEIKLENYHLPKNNLEKMGVAFSYETEKLTSLRTVRLFLPLH